MGHRSTVKFTRCETFQWILTKLGTYLVLKRIWNPIDFQSQRSRSPGKIFRQGDTPALPLFSLDLVSMIYKQDLDSLKD
jgi:hypothetical protein